MGELKKFECPFFILPTSFCAVLQSCSLQVHTTTPVSEKKKEHSAAAFAEKKEEEKELWRQDLLVCLLGSTWQEERESGLGGRKRFLLAETFSASRTRIFH